MSDLKRGDPVWLRGAVEAVVADGLVLIKISGAGEVCQIVCKDEVFKRSAPPDDHLTPPPRRQSGDDPN